MIKNGAYVRDILLGAPGSEVTAHGWVKTRRDSKGVHFIQISDGSCFQDLQVVIDQGKIAEDVLHRDRKSVV
jgi:asparaginyl-tRNA synthetase